MRLKFEHEKLQEDGFNSQSKFNEKKNSNNLKVYFLQFEFFITK